MTSSDRFPVPVRSAVKSNLTDWCFQNLSKRALNALTVQASATELGKLIQIFTNISHTTEANATSPIVRVVKYAYERRGLSEKGNCSLNKIKDILQLSLLFVY